MIKEVKRAIDTVFSKYNITQITKFDHLNHLFGIILIYKNNCEWFVHINTF